MLGSVQYELFCNSNFNYGTVSTIEVSIEMGSFLRRGERQGEGQIFAAAKALEDLLGVRTATPIDPR